VNTSINNNASSGSNSSSNNEANNSKIICTGNVADKIDIKLIVNGKNIELKVYPMMSLLDVLRGELSLTGTKKGCGEGECGACVVFMNGKLVNSCLVPAMQIDGAVIQTIEGVENKELLFKVQASFLQNGGAQCGFCTPGMVLATVNLLEHNPTPTDNDIKKAFAGNLCRCTGYMKIIESVKNVNQKAPKIGGKK